MKKAIIFIMCMFFSSCIYYMFESDSQRLLKKQYKIPISSDEEEDEELFVGRGNGYLWIFCDSVNDYALFDMANKVDKGYRLVDLEWYNFGNDRYIDQPVCSKNFLWLFGGLLTFWSPLATKVEVRGIFAPTKNKKYDFKSIYGFKPTISFAGFFRSLSSRTYDNYGLSLSTQLTRYLGAGIEYNLKKHMDTPFFSSARADSQNTKIHELNLLGSLHPGRHMYLLLGVSLEKGEGVYSPYTGAVVLSSDEKSYSPILERFTYFNFSPLIAVGTKLTFGPAFFKVEWLRLKSSLYRSGFDNGHSPDYDTRFLSLYLGVELPFEK